VLKGGGGHRVSRGAMVRAGDGGCWWWMGSGMATGGGCWGRAFAPSRRVPVATPTSWVLKFPTYSIMQSIVFQFQGILGWLMNPVICFVLIQNMYVFMGLYTFITIIKTCSYILFFVLCPDIFLLSMLSCNIGG
jgi:hypothetical protein